MAVLCEFTNQSFPHGEQFYACEVKNQIIPENKDVKLIESFQNVKINDDVHGVKFSNCTINKIPSGLTKLFPNLKFLIIISSKLKNISKNDLKEYKSIEKFICEGNDVEFLPGDLFEGFSNLVFISFSMNKLNDIEANILDQLPNLKHVNFKNNPKYSKAFSIYPVYKANATLDDVMSQLFEKFYTKIENVKKMMQKYEQEIQQLKNPEGNLLKFSAPSTVAESEYQKLVHRLQTGIFGDLEAYILDEKSKDFKVIIGSQEFPVHKFLLAARSSTLAELLKNNPEAENLKLLDLSAEIFGKILKFLYTDELPGDDGTDFLEIFAAAGKLKIQELKNFAAGKIFDQLNEENAFEILKQSNKYQIFELRDKAFQMIKNKHPNIEIKDEWASEPEKLFKIVQNIKMKEEAKRKYEEEIRKLDEQFEHSMIK